MRNDRRREEIVELVFARMVEAGYEQLNETQKCLVCVWAAAGEIGNGGLERFVRESEPALRE